MKLYSTVSCHPPLEGLKRNAVPQPGGPLFSGFNELLKVEEINLIGFPIPAIFVGTLAACLTVFIDKRRMAGVSPLIYRRYSFILALLLGGAGGLVLGLYLGTHGWSNQCC